MKKLLLLPLLVLPLLTGCDGNKEVEKYHLTFGSKMQLGNEDAIKELSSSELLAKTRDEKEVFLLAVYQGEYSETCLCWNTYQEALKNYCFNYSGLVYLYNAQNVEPTMSHLKIEKLNESTPYLYIFNGEKLIQKFSHSNRKYRTIFEDTTGKEMNDFVSKYVKRPYLYYTDEATIDSTKDQTVMFIRHGCNDCKYSLNEVVIPYIKEKIINQNIYLLDMQKYYDIAKYEGATEEEKVSYQNLKDKYGLSEAEGNLFGYQQGVVPTIQYRKDGKVEAAAIYFNDVIDKKDDGSYYIADSFYSEERKAALNNQYTFPNILKGMTITEGIIEGKNGTYYWSQGAANKYHKPNFKAFLDYYLSAEAAA